MSGERIPRRASRAGGFPSHRAARPSPLSPMSERQLQFRVGVFVIFATVAMIVMVFEFGNLQNRLRPKYKVAIRFRSAVGISVGTPVRRNGVLIGSVTNVQFDDKSGRPGRPHRNQRRRAALARWARAARQLASGRFGDRVPARPQHEIAQGRRHGRGRVGHRPAQHGRTHGAERLDRDRFVREDEPGMADGWPQPQPDARDQSGKPARRGGAGGRCPDTGHPHDESHGRDARGDEPAGRRSADAGELAPHAGRFALPHRPKRRKR